MLCCGGFTSNDWQSPEVTPVVARPIALVASAVVVATNDNTEVVVVARIITWIMVLWKQAASSNASCWGSNTTR